MRAPIAAALFLTLFCTAASPASAGEDAPPPPSLDFRVVRRIELACRIGVEKAETEADVLASLRWRNAALAAFVEIAYQATLAWLSDRPVRAAALEEEQGLWLDELAAMQGRSREDLERIGEVLHRRLAVFSAFDN